VIVEAHLYGREQSTAVLETDTIGVRGTNDRRVGATDLIEFGRCPWRWRWGADPERFMADRGPTLTEWLSFDEVSAKRYLVRRPDTYEAAKLECPRCQSEGPAKVCKKCGLRRKGVVRPRTWNSAAKVCAEWAQKVEEQRRTAIAPAEWDRALAGAESVRAEKCVMGLARGCDYLRTLFGTYEDESTGLQIPLWSRATLVPRSASARQPVLVSLVETRNADPSIWEGSAFATGAHIRAALLMELWNKLENEDCREHLWILVEKEAPRLVARRRASQELLKEGRTRLAELLAAYARALFDGHWPKFEPEGNDKLEAWQMCALQPWMTSGAGPHGGYFAPMACLEAA
jgi:hypothetical protein